MARRSILSQLSGNLPAMFKLRHRSYENIYCNPKYLDCNGVLLFLISVDFFSGFFTSARSEFRLVILIIGVVKGAIKREVGLKRDFFQIPLKRSEKLLFERILGF